jgi:hypothetical protein
MAEPVSKTYEPPLPLDETVVPSVNVYAHNQKLGPYAYIVKPRAGKDSKTDTAEDFHDFLASGRDGAIVDFFRAAARLACCDPELKDARLIWNINAVKGGMDASGQSYPSYLQSKDSVTHWHGVFARRLGREIIAEDIHNEKISGAFERSYCRTPKDGTHFWIAGRAGNVSKLVEVPNVLKEADTHFAITLPRGYKDFLDFSAHAKDEEILALAGLLKDHIQERVKTGGVRIVCDGLNQSGAVIHLLSTTRPEGFRSRWFQAPKPA